MEDTSHPCTIRFSDSDVDNFCRASGDRNPLHISTLYARKTPFGESVVYGALVVIDAINKARLPGFGRLSWLKAEFMHPIYRDTSYDMIETDGDDKTRISIREGSQERTRIDLGFDHSTAQRDCDFSHGPVFPRDVAQRLDAEQVAAAGKIAGQYNPDAIYLAELTDRMQPRAAIGRPNIAALMACSYIAGMEIPGQQSLIRSISLDFEGCPLPEIGNLHFSAEASKVNTRVGLATIAVQLSIGGQSFANGEICTIVRPQSTTTGHHAGPAQQVFDSMHGRVVVLIGGSRGIGAALAQAFTWHGATVIAVFQECVEDAQLVQEAVANARGTMQLVQGDATDADWCLHLKERVLQEHGHVDVLVCNACPSVRGIQFSAATVSRINSYVAQSLALIDVPMAAFMDTITETRGACVVISSQALENKPSEWPHYVAAKAAAEALVEVLAKQNHQVGFLNARPPKTLTDQMNTNLGRLDALKPERVAEAIVRNVSETLDSGNLAQQVQILREF